MLNYCPIHSTSIVQKYFATSLGKIQQHSGFVFEVISPYFKPKQCSDNINFVAFPIKVYKTVAQQSSVLLPRVCGGGVGWCWGLNSGPCICQTAAFPLSNPQLLTLVTRTGKICKQGSCLTCKCLKDITLWFPYYKVLPVRKCPFRWFPIY